ncbi:MAG: hypothetical protein ABSE54_11705 [Smithella sp.]
MKRRYIRLKEPSIFLTTAGLTTEPASMVIPTRFRNVTIFYKLDTVV